jgi:hypothetical protein
MFPLLLNDRETIELISSKASTISSRPFSWCGVELVKRTCIKDVCC